ncbi:MAG: ATP-binding protein [Nitrospinales bacterium]
MQIRTLHIDGFGKFFNRNISGFESGLNIVYGENESGKTTVLEFIRRVLFGFNVKKIGGIKNIYPPLLGGIYGGQISCLTSKEKPFTIKRNGKPGSKDVQVSIQMNSKEFSGQEYLDELLGHATENNYKNIYAFTLDELQDFGLLSNEHVKNQIYGAGLGLGQISLSDVKSFFDKRCEEIFLPKGIKPSMNKILTDIKKLEQEIADVKSQSSQFETLTMTLNSLYSDQKIIESKIEKLKSHNKSQQTRWDLYPAFTGIVEAQNELKSLGATVDFPLNGMNDFNLFKSKLKTCEASIKEESANKEGLENQREKIQVNDNLLKFESDIFNLMKMTDNVRSALHDKIDIEQSINSLNKTIQGDITHIGIGWNESQVANTSFTEEEKNNAINFGSKMTTIQQTITSLEDQLVSHRERKALENSNGWEILAWGGIAGFAFVSLGIVGFILGFMQNNYPLLSFSIAVFIFGGLFSWQVKKSKKKLDSMDVLESTLVAKLRQAVIDNDSILKDWKSWLVERNFEPNLIPAALGKVFSQIDKVKDMLVQRENLDQRLEKMLKTENEANVIAQRITNNLPNINFDENILKTIEVLGQNINDSKQLHNKRSILDSKIEVTNIRLVSLKKEQDDLSSKLEDLIRSAGASDENNFLQKHKIFERQNHLKKATLEKQNLIQASVDTDEAYNQFFKELENTTKEDLQKEHDLASEQFKRIEADRSTLNQSIGEVRNKLNQLVSSDDLLILQTNLEMKKEKLNNLSREWAVSRLALSLLAKGKREYEKNRQPAVIKSASKLFSEMTGYSKIMKPLDSDSLIIFDENEKKKGVGEMSRGTREQLYLSMRLGLIEEYESRSEPLPVVMDDVFVNFDDDRRDKVIEILKEFSMGRQVIILSCHKHSLDLYSRHGAKQVHIN